MVPSLLGFVPSEPFLQKQLTPLVFTANKGLCVEFVQTASLQECVASMNHQALFVKSGQTATGAYRRAPPSVGRELPLEGAR